MGPILDLPPQMPAAIKQQLDKPYMRERRPRRLAPNGPTCVVTRRTGYRTNPLTGKREEVREVVKTW